MKWIRIRPSREKKTGSRFYLLFTYEIDLSYFCFKIKVYNIDILVLYYHLDVQIVIGHVNNRIRIRPYFETGPGSDQDTRIRNLAFQGVFSI